MGKIEDTDEAGGYVGYQSGNFAAKLDVRQALSGGQGLIATLGLHYVADISLSPTRSEAHTSELQSLMRTSYAVFCLTKKNENTYTSANRALPHASYNNP